MGDSLAQAALILVHLNLFSSTANWDLGLGRRAPLCACVFRDSQGQEGGGCYFVCLFVFWATYISLNSEKKEEKKSNIYKAGEVKGA